MISICDGLKDFRLSFEGCEMQKEKLDDLVVLLEQSARAIDNVARNMAHPRVFNEVHSDAAPSVIARRVFGVAELTEKILSFLDIPDMLHVMQVDKSFLDTIEGSTKLLNQLRVRPDHPRFCSVLKTSTQSLRNKYIATSSMTFPHLKVRVSDSYMGSQDASTESFPVYSTSSSCDIGKSVRKAFIQGVVEFDGTSSKLRVGERLRKMLICQPPLREIHGYVECCQLRASRPSTIRPKDDSTFAVKADTGITTGHLYDAAKEAVERHRLCPHARTALHDENGLVCPAVFFEAGANLELDDPLITQPRVYMPDFEDFLRKRVTQGYPQSLKRYILEKQRSESHRARVPQFPE